MAVATISVNFASLAEALAGTLATKSISPATLYSVIQSSLPQNYILENTYRYIVGTTPAVPVNSTSVAGADLFGNTLYYVTPNVNVFLNGSHLVQGLDYIANNNTTIASLDPLGAGDVVDVVTLSTYNITQLATVSSFGGVASLSGANGVSITPATGQGNVTVGLVMNQIIPTGVIVMWSGSIASIPTGWTLCNGSNGTPDLRDRFIVGAGTTYNPGNTGGLSAVQLTIAQMPSHNHTAVDSGHTHGVPGGSGGGALVAEGEIGRQYTIITDAGFANVTIGNTGSDQPHENRPPYFALAYIMKL